MINLAKFTGQSIEYVEGMNVVKALNYLGYIAAENALINSMNENQ